MADKNPDAAASSDDATSSGAGASPDDATTAATTDATTDATTAATTDANTDATTAATTDATTDATTEATLTEPDPDATSGGKTPLIITIVSLVGILIVVGILAAFGVFAPADDDPVAEPTETPEVTEEPAPEPEPELAGFVTPETWCTAVRNVALEDFPDSPSFVWWATVLTTDDGELVAEGTEFEVVVPDADIEPIEAVVGEFGILEVPGGPFVEFEVTEAEFGPECEGPEEPALDDLILNSELFV
jgi:hypothetical protein